jgi:hypothetical protein
LASSELWQTCSLTKNKQESTGNNKYQSSDVVVCYAAVSRLVDLLCTEWSIIEMPKGLKFILQSLARHNGGSIDPCECLIRYVLIPGVTHWMNMHNINIEQQYKNRRRRGIKQVSVLDMLQRMSEMKSLNLSTREEESYQYLIRRLFQLISTLAGSTPPTPLPQNNSLNDSGVVDQIVLSNVSRNFLRDYSQRVVVSCFDLYLLHMGLTRYNNSNAWPVLPEHLKNTLKIMGKPLPLPGTKTCGSTENPFFIIKLRETPNPFSRVESNKLDK